MIDKKIYDLDYEGYTGYKRKIRCALIDRVNINE